MSLSALRGMFAVLLMLFVCNTNSFMIFLTQNGALNSQIGTAYNRQTSERTNNFRFYPRWSAAVAGDESEAEKARLNIIVNGPHATNALFRAELKKELTFFRGCGASFTETAADSAVIIAEGKKVQLEKFLAWLQFYGTELVQRKPSFQSPSLTVHIKEMNWQPFGGDLKGFISANAVPDLSSLASGDSPAAEGRMDARSMTGTDESV